jgi:uncharacterized protein
LKFQPDQLPGVNVISRQQAGSVWVNAQPFARSLLVPWQGEPQVWAASAFDALTAAHFDALLPLEPELVIFGSGTRLRFVSPALYRSLIERRIGIETMDTAAACRTYNVLASEGRSVVAALIVEGLAA